ncbi:MAG: indolepyruvate ferredoxin oxidoreductase subunit alpha [Clostridia bacterium]
MKQYLSGNEVAALAALDAGASVITGYPGTPSSELIGSIWGKKIENTEIQWSTNEKVAFEIAAAASWANKSALCTMKMSGLNVAYDSLISVMYSGCSGALVLYVCDDPGVSAGMPEQDVRGFAIMSDMVVLEPSSVEDTYELVKFAFYLSNSIKSPVMVRSVTNVALSHATVEIPERTKNLPTEPHFEHNIEKYTKAGAKICMNQHRDLIDRLSLAGKIISEKNINELELAPDCGGLGVVAVGVSNSFLDEALTLAFGTTNASAISKLKVKTSHPIPEAELTNLLKHCESVIIIEENEPYVEDGAIRIAYQNKLSTVIYGKHTGAFSRIGSFNARLIANGILRALGIDAPEENEFSASPEIECAARPIGVCAGCPHRGVYMALNAAFAKCGIKKDEMLVTGDIGCTILGMSPPFNTLSTEVSMGASVAMAQGFIYAGIKTPMVSTMGDSTFLHAGIPPLINAVQNRVNMTAIIMDNGWTAMTGMQVNANTDGAFQQDDGKIRIDIARLIPALGVEEFSVVDPYDVNAMTNAILDSFKKDGVKVILSRRECAIQAGRRKIKYGIMSVDSTKCVGCKLCVIKSGCPALVFNGNKVSIDQKTCNGCGICKSLCNFNAISKEKPE